MERICILTDSSAQFPQHTFAGQSLVRVIPYDIAINGTIYPEGKDFHINQLPGIASEQLYPRLIAPSIEKFAEWFRVLGQNYSEILVILQSPQFSKAYDNAVEATTHVKGSLKIQVINSQTISAGLGLLVQIAGKAVEQGMPFQDIDYMIRKQAAALYTLVCTPGLSYLYHAGLLNREQAVVGEMLNLLPVFSIEEDRIISLEKLRGFKNTVDLFTEFVYEFEDLQHIALIQSNPPILPETRTIRMQFQEQYPTTTYSEHNLNAPMATIFGPKLISLIIAESVTND